jgi:hypothetical protein
MRYLPKWIIWLLGDDRNVPYTVVAPKLKCATCHRLVDYVEKDAIDAHEWLHADDASEICKPVGVYRS